MTPGEITLTWDIYGKASLETLRKEIILIILISALLIVSACLSGRQPACHNSNYQAQLKAKQGYLIGPPGNS